MTGDIRFNILAGSDMVKEYDISWIQEQRDNGATFAEIGAILGLSRQRIHQLLKQGKKRNEVTTEEKALFKLTRFLSELNKEEMEALRPYIDNIVYQKTYHRQLYNRKKRETKQQ